MKLQAERTTLNALLSARYEPTAESAAILNFIVFIILLTTQQGFRESVSLLKFTGELPPSDSEDEEEEEGASDTPGREGSSEQKSSGVDGISVGDFLRGTVGKARERRQVGRPRRFDQQFLKPTSK